MASHGPCLRAVVTSLSAPVRPPWATVGWNDVTRGELSLPTSPKVGGRSMFPGERAISVDTLSSRTA